MSKTGLIFNIQRFSLHDGPGIRTTIFFKGCPLNCMWCQNPEGLSSNKEIFQSTIKCIGCNSCLEFCPEGSISNKDRERVIDRKTCKLCMTCADNCPTGALEAIGKEMTITEMIDEVLKDRLIFEESGGGVTLSGGEPLLQVDFVAELLKAMKNLNINTAVETSGYVSLDALKRVSPWTDLFLYDIKLLDPEICKKYTGMPNKNVINNLKHLAQNESQLLIRMPLIPGINDNLEHLKLVAAILRENGINELEIIPYHNLGAHKYMGLNLDYKMQNLEPPSKKQVAAVRKAFLNEGISTRNEV